MKTYRKILSGLISIWTRFFWWMKLSPFAMSSAIFFTCQTSSFLFNCLRESISSSRFPPLQYSIWMNTLNWYKSNGHVKKWTVGNAKEPKAYGHFLRMVVKLKRIAQNPSDSGLYLAGLWITPSWSVDSGLRFKTYLDPLLSSLNNIV